MEEQRQICKTLWSPENKSYIGDTNRSASNLKSVLRLLSLVPSFCQPPASEVKFGFKFCLLLVSQLADGNLEISQQVATFSFGKEEKRPKNEQLFV